MSTPKAFNPNWVQDWLRAVDEALLEYSVDVVEPTDTYVDAERKLDKLLIRYVLCNSVREESRHDN